MDYLTEIGVITGVVTGSVSLALVIYKTLKEKPNMQIKFIDGNWFKRHDHSLVTSFGIHVRIDNKGERNTTVHSASLEIEYEGKKYSMKSGIENIMVESSSSLVKQFIFNLSIDEIVIDENIVNSKLFLNHTHGTAKTDIPLIKKPA